MSSRLRRISAAILVSAAFVASAAGAVQAKGAPTRYIARLTPVPNPPGAPEKDTFLITVPHSHKVPHTAVFRFVSPAGQHSTSTSPLKPLGNKIQYEAVWTAKQQGHVEVQVYTASHELMVEASYPVKKAKVHMAGRVIVGALFIGAAMWMWWRQRRWSMR